MKKNTLLYLAIAGVGGYFLYKKFAGGGTDSDESGTTSKGTDSDESEGSETGGKKVTLNAGFEEDGIDRKLNKAKEILENVKDVSEVFIKTPKGQQNVKVTRKPKSRQIKRYKRLANSNCAKIKRAKRRARCESKKASAVQWLQSHNVQ